MSERCTPVGPQALLGGLDQAGATHDQSARLPLTNGAGRVGASGDLRLAAGQPMSTQSVSSIPAIAAAMLLVPQRTAAV